MKRLRLRDSTEFSQNAWQWENLKLIGTFVFEPPLSASDVPQGSLSLGEDAEREHWRCFRTSDA